MKKSVIIRLRSYCLSALFCVLWIHPVSAQGLVKIADNIYSYMDVKQGSPQNSFGANAGIIIGQDGIVVIDTLISAKEAKRFIQDIRLISDKPIRYVINTHYHLDHAFGNSEFAKLGAVIIAQENGHKNLKEKGEATLKNVKGYGLSEPDMEGTSIAVPSLTFRDKMELDLGNQKIELIYTGPSHSNDSILVFLPDKKVLFAGDILFTNYHPFIADGNLEGWGKVLDNIMAMDVSKIIPGHGPLSSKKDIREMKEYLVTFDSKAKELSAKYKEPEKIFSEIKKALPERAQGEMLIMANIQMRYLKK
ncbi:MAG: MBL fold metallo-hydrolase [Desulfobacca sp.]|nr:MBL fold metallo-hydrolase [Desulfobacca sp.]